MKRSIIWYGFIAWSLGWSGGLLDHWHPILANVVALGGYALLVFTSKGE